MRRLLTNILTAILLFVSTSAASAAQPKVQALLFFSPTCPHCHKVITEVLPPLQQKYGAQLEVGMVDISTEKGQAVYQAAIERFSIPEDRRGVPAMIFGTTVMVGSREIPNQLPGLIEEGLKSGGVSYPDLPGLQGALTTSPWESEIPQPGLAEKLGRDPLGNGLSIVVLAGMIAAVVWSALRKPRKKTVAKLHNKKKIVKTAPIPAWKQWGIPILALVGLGISAYMAYVETTASPAVCGPVGDCNTVQQSEYALLLGFLPVGVFGLLGNLSILAAWAVKQYGKGNLPLLADKALVALTTFGILFSIYLTFLEPFVIGATCAWCLSSAVVMTGMFLLSIDAVK